MSSQPRPSRPRSPPPALSPPTQGVTFDVMFRQRQLGLGLAWRNTEVVIVDVDGAAKRAEVQKGDALTAIEGVKVRSLDDAYERLRTGARPMRLTFRASETKTERRNLTLPTPPPNKTKGVTILKIQCDLVKVATPTAHPKDAVLCFKIFKGTEELGRVQLRGALSKPAKRAVVAVRAASGAAAKAGVQPGDVLVAVDDALVAPPANANGVALLVNKCADYARRKRENSNEPTTLIFARTGNNKKAPELLYTVALPTQRRSSFGGNREQIDLRLLETLEEEEDEEDPQPKPTQRSVIARFRARQNDDGVLARCWGLELHETHEALVVGTATSDISGARANDVVALLDNRPACAHNLLTFGVDADAAVANALSTGRRAVALTLAHPELFQQEKRLFLGMASCSSSSHQTQKKKNKKKPQQGTAPPYDDKVELDVTFHDYDDDLPRISAPASRGDSIVMRESWGAALSDEERLRLGEMMRLLGSGLGVEIYAATPKSPRESRTFSQRPKPVTLGLLANCAGLAVRPVYGAKTRIPFADVITVDLPMMITDHVSDEVLASSFFIKYRIHGGEKATLNVATESPIMAHKLAESILVAMRRQIPVPASVSPVAAHPRERSYFGRRFSAERKQPRIEARQQSNLELPQVSPSRSPQPRHASHRFSRDSVDNAIQRATRNIARVALVTNDASNPKQNWWKTLRRGVVVEVLYADSRTYTIKTPLGNFGSSNAVETSDNKRGGAHRRRRSGRDAGFRQGQYCRAEVLRILRSRDPNGPREAPPRIRYILKYKDGPYDCDVAEPPRSTKQFMKGTLFVDVPRSLIVVNMSNQELYLPLSVVALSLAQIGAFIYYANRKPGGVSADGPIIGPTNIHYFLTGEFPQCRDARRDYWRLFTYQFAHIGYYHLAANVFVQLVFGTPVELVHGHFLVFLVYELGVAAGSLTCSFADIHKGVVGASGGVYCLIGLHSSDCWVNWRALAQDMRLLVRGSLCVVVPTIDIVLYVFFSKDDGTSYAAHIGGWIAGFLFGLAFLQQVSESFLHVYFTRPVAVILLVAFLLFSFGWHQFTYPPKFFINGPFWQLRSYSTNDRDSSGSCCWQLLNCDGVNEADYDRFSCDQGATLYGGYFRGDETLEPLHTCFSLVSWLASHPESEAAGFD